ncbi:hypothetical protein M5K25_013562 [Dendrobium thyrsiflorum]|uniref:Uncharacterized protein n=1 Tax=Dendrobium thyrsiflorum TaxID=117978 RepID=A0ABD0UTZ3_DENTH
MEGVGARLGRSSARYAPTTVFSGPVRRWKKKWVPLSNPNNSNSNNNNHSHLLLFKWTPINTLSNGTAAATPPASSKDATSADATPPSASEEAPRRKFRYIPDVLVMANLECASNLGPLDCLLFSVWAFAALSLGLWSFLGRAGRLGFG